MWHNTQKSRTCTIAQRWDLWHLRGFCKSFPASVLSPTPRAFNFSAATPTIERMLLNWFFISKSIDLFTFHFSLYFDLNKCRSNDLSSACSRCLLNVLRFPPSQAAESREAGENLISARDGICVNIMVRRRRRRFLREHKMYNFRVSPPAPEGISPLPHINIFWCIIWRFSYVKLHATGYTHMEWFEMYTFLLASPWSHECKYRSANVEHFGWTAVWSTRIKILKEKIIQTCLMTLVL